MAYIATQFATELGSTRGDQSGPEVPDDLENSDIMGRYGTCGDSPRRPRANYECVALPAELPRPWGWSDIDGTEASIHHLSQVTATSPGRSASQTIPSATRQTSPRNRTTRIIVRIASVGRPSERFERTRRELLGSVECRGAASRALAASIQVAAGARTGSGSRCAPAISPRVALSSARAITVDGSSPRGHRAAAGERRTGLPSGAIQAITGGVAPAVGKLGLKPDVELLLGVVAEHDLTDAAVLAGPEAHWALSKPFWGASGNFPALVWRAVDHFQPLDCELISMAAGLSVPHQDEGWRLHQPAIPRQGGVSRFSGMRPSTTASRAECCQPSLTNGGFLAYPKSFRARCGDYQRREGLTTKSASMKPSR